MQTALQKNEQVTAVLAALRSIFGDALLAVYLHGSAVSVGLRPQSDIDLLAVVDRSLNEAQRAALLAALLRLSGHYPARHDGARCLEVMVFSRADLDLCPFPARADFVYGEWLRGAFEAGEEPMPAQDPEFTLVLAQARQEAIALFGPDRDALLPEVTTAAIRQAMSNLLPALLDSLHDDTRNVLLTLARMWHTAISADFLSKDEAAIRALPMLGGQDATTLDYARRAYLGEITDEWQSRRNAAQQLADQLALNVTEALSA